MDDWLIKAGVVLALLLLVAYAGRIRNSLARRFGDNALSTKVFAAIYGFADGSTPTYYPPDAPPISTSDSTQPDSPAGSRRHRARSDAGASPVAILAVLLMCALVAAAIYSAVALVVIDALMAPGQMPGLLQQPIASDAWWTLAAGILATFAAAIVVVAVHGRTDVKLAGVSLPAILLLAAAPVAIVIIRSLAA